MLIFLKANRTICGLFLLLMFAHNLFGKTEIKGRITDSAKNPVFAVNIFLKNDNSTGTVSDLEGLFHISVETSSKNDTLVFSCLGFLAEEIPVNDIVINEFLDITLTENKNILDEITVFGQPSVTKEFSIKELDRVTIYMLPISSGDPLKAIASLPYSTNISESANPEIRGSSSDYSRVIVNNVPVYKPVKNTQLNGMGNFSLFNAEIVDNQLVYAGNPPLKYGNSLSGLVEIETTKELKKNKQLKASLSIANMGLLYSQKIKNESFLQLYGNYQFSSVYLQLNKKNTDYISDFKTYDIGFNFHQKISKRWSANVYSYGVSEEYNAENAMYNYRGNLLSNAKRNFNIINIEYLYKKIAFSINNGTNFSATDFKFGNFSIGQKEHQVYTSIDSKISVTPFVSLQVGLSHDYSKEFFFNTLPYYYFSILPADSTYSFTNTTKNNNIEAYIYGKFVLKKIILGLGIRKNLPVRGQSSYLSYQVNFRYNINLHNSIILSGGAYNGYSIPNYIVEDFHHASSNQIGFDYLFHLNQFNFNFSLYSRRDNQPFFYQELGELNRTDIETSGAEFSIDYTVGKFNILGSYVYLNSRMNKGNGWFKASNSMNYLVRSGISYFNDKWINASLHFTFRPGLCYTPIIKSEYDSEADNYKPIYGDIYSQKYAPYSSIDLTINKVLAYRNSNVVFFCTISNLLNTSNQEKKVNNHDYSSVDYWFHQKRILYFGLTFSF